MLKVLVIAEYSIACNRVFSALDLQELEEGLVA
jgi:hypothetical protein